VHVPGGVQADYFALVCVVVYLVFAAVFWGAALPDYLDAVHGITAWGSPTGSLAVAVTTYVLSIAQLFGAYATTGWRTRQSLPSRSEPAVSADAFSKDH
jgi:hypothetical protein